MEEEDYNTIIITLDEDDLYEGQQYNWPKEGELSLLPFIPPSNNDREEKIKCKSILNLNLKNKFTYPAKAAFDIINKYDEYIFDCFEGVQGQVSVSCRTSLFL